MTKNETFSFRKQDIKVETFAKVDTILTFRTGNTRAETTFAKQKYIYESGECL